MPPGTCARRPDGVSFKLSNDINFKNLSGETTMNSNLNPSTENEKRTRLPRGVIAGSILVLIGVFALLPHFITLPGTAMLIGLGLVFLAWGLLTRTSGLLIPGGVLTGIFAGTTLIEGPFAQLADPARGGVFLAAFAGGWVLITLLSLYTESPRPGWTWPLYPAVILALIAAALLAGDLGLKALELSSYIWPVALIGFGLYLVFRRRAQ
jgi:hypothetical protein